MVSTLQSSKYGSSSRASSNDRKLNTSQVACLLVVVIIFSGCQSNPLNSPMEKVGAQQAIAVIPARYEPDSNFATFARSQTGGATKGAGEGVVGGAVGGGLLGLQDPLLILFTPYLAAAGAVVGGVAGTVTGMNSIVPAKDTEAIERMISTAISDLHLPELTAKAVVETEMKFGPYRAELIPDVGPTSKLDYPDYRPLAASGFGGAIEVRVVRLGFTGGHGSDPEMSFFLTADARLIDVATGKATWLRGLGYGSPRYKASVWARDNAVTFKRELERAYWTLGERIVDSFIFAAEISPVKNGPEWGLTCGLTPTDPIPRQTRNFLKGYTQEVATVSSLTPRLSWQPFAQAEPYFAGASSFPRILHVEAHDVRYDLRVWRQVQGTPPEMVYERVGLKTAEHQMEQTLEPNTEYLWSVRPRFDLEGHPRALRWSAMDHPVFNPPAELVEAVYFTELDGSKPKPSYCTISDEILLPTFAEYSKWTPCHCLDFVPQENSYRFRTP